MAEDFDNPIDDDLLRELGLEPKQQNGASEADVGEEPEDEDMFDSEPQAHEEPESVPDEIEPEPEPEPVTPEPRAAQEFRTGLKGLAQDMPIQMVAVLGKKTMTLKDVLSLKQGEIVDLKKLPNETVDLVANGKLVARGELVLVDGKIGIQIRQLIS